MKVVEREATIIEVEINGRPRRVEEGTSVSGLLASLDLDERAVVVELNRQILRRNELGAVILEPGDRLELVHFVGGG